jgi:enoyl-CoA hydratase/carnithine racemase
MRVRPLLTHDDAHSFVFARRGIVPEACSSYFLPRLVGTGKALEWCLTGRVFRARTEAASGLFNHVVPADAVLPKALEIATEIAAHTSAVSVALTKHLLWDAQRDGANPEQAHLNDSKCIFYMGCAGFGASYTACECVLTSCVQG